MQQSVNTPYLKAKFLDTTVSQQLVAGPFYSLTICIKLSKIPFF
uniref:Uncharacterized protein n=1 Tax=Arundo donax TaxID=35708 RepID=A0A0A9G4K6_ARUDO